MLSALVLLHALGVPTVFAHDRAWPGRRLAETMPEASTFTARPVPLSAAQIDWVAKALGAAVPPEDRAPTFYVGIDSAGAAVGVVIILDADGVNGTVEMADGIAPDGKLLRVALFEHAEPSAVGKADFLGQLAGKGASDMFMVGHDLTAPAGAEKSAQAIATAARRGLLLAAAGLGIGVGGGAK